MATPGIPGFEEISDLATTYSPQQLQLMAARGQLDLGKATRAKFLQDRIAAEVARSKMSGLHGIKKDYAKALRLLKQAKEKGYEKASAYIPLAQAEVDKEQGK